MKPIAVWFELTEFCRACWYGCGRPIGGVVEYTIHGIGEPGRILGPRRPGEKERAPTDDAASRPRNLSWSTAKSKKK